tara:strand:+ start:810 stop:998 length:189 start_codon:yes stop_codon:yes gene_type:complete
MKYEATEKFFELDTMGNYQGLGKEIFQKLESGKVVDCKPPDWMVKDGYVQKGSQSKTKKEDD